MDKFWTSKKPINGLRHFVLLNETKEKEDTIFFMVSVIDSKVNLNITYKELVKSGNWDKGWINIPNIESITKEYFNYKSSNKGEVIDEIYVHDDSSFNIT